MIYKIELTEQAEKMIKDISDKRVMENIIKRVDGLASEPDKQGKALTGNLSEFRSIRAAGQRYRIIYKIQKKKIIVYIVSAGIRKEGNEKDIYALTKKLIRLGLIEIPDKIKITEEILGKLKSKIKDVKKINCLISIKNKVLLEEELREILLNSSFTEEEINFIFELQGEK